MKNYGLIIAIEDYSKEVLPELSKIEFALSDATSIRKVFNEQLQIDEDNITFLTNENASRSNIQKASKNIFTRMGTDDTFYF
jgi:hypothetical protein